jgi:hypothetical protein
LQLLCIIWTSPFPLFIKGKCCLLFVCYWTAHMLVRQKPRPDKGCSATDDDMFVSVNAVFVKWILGHNLLVCGVFLSTNCS